jgi:phosphohistidine phosphatase SixA
VNRLLARLASFVCIGLVCGIAAAQGAALPNADAGLIESLRAGGYVIYMRHASTDTGGLAESGPVDLADCATQRNLSDKGKREAAAIGQALTVLRVPLGEVRSSPYCRCRDTARAVAGRFVVDEDLHFAFGATPQRVAQLSARLRALLAAPPRPGANSLIVSHTANLREAAGIWPKPEGVAIVFRPLGDGRFEALAKIEPRDWVRLAGAGQPAPRAAR